MADGALDLGGIPALDDLGIWTLRDLEGVHRSDETHDIHHALGVEAQPHGFFAVGYVRVVENDFFYFRVALVPVPLVSLEDDPLAGLQCVKIVAPFDQLERSGAPGARRR